MGPRTATVALSWAWRQVKPGGQLDQPLGRHLGAGVGGVEVDGPLGTGVAAGDRLRGLEVAHRVQELVQGVGQVRGDGVGGADRAGGVGTVDDQVVGGAAGPAGDRPHDRPDLGLGVRAEAARSVAAHRPAASDSQASRAAGSSPGGPP